MQTEGSPSGQEGSSRPSGDRGAGNGDRGSGRDPHGGRGGGGAEEATTRTAGPGMETGRFRSLVVSLQ